LNNPQYRFDVEKDGDEVVVQLSQRDRRADGGQLLVIGFHIMRVEANRRYRLHRVQEKAFTSDYVKTKHIFLKKNFRKGR